MANSDSNTVKLNNYLQTTSRTTAALSWGESLDGPRHAPMWTILCKINGKVVAQGTGASKTAAKEDAAKAALAVLEEPTPAAGQAQAQAE